MYITYHKQMSCSGAMFKIPHNVLCSEIREFLRDRDVIDEYYTCSENGFYFFICLDNGDRIDCQL